MRNKKLLEKYLTCTHLYALHHSTLSLSKAKKQPGGLANYDHLAPSMTQHIFAFVIPLATNSINSIASAKAYIQVQQFIS